jgi:hypothetical protein
MDDGWAQGELMAQAAPLYFNTHFPNSRWISKATALIQAASPSSLIHAHHPLWQQGKTKVIPAAWQSGWMLELSPNPLLLPSVLFYGEGAELQCPTAMTEAAKDAVLFARLNPLNGDNSLYFSPSLWWRLGQ